MANSIALFKKYIDLLDEVYQAASCTSVLDINGALVRAGVNANEIVIPKLKLDGLADYSRNSGYVGGDVDFSFETVKFNYDRGRKFNVDAMDDEETAGMSFGQLASEFIRTKAVPEADAFRFATYASKEGIGKKAETLDAADDFFTAVRAGVNALDEAEVSVGERYLFVTPTLYNAAMAADSYKSRAILDDFVKIIKVPQTRFYTAIKLKDGKTSGDEIGGYEKAAGGADINFMIVDKSAIIQLGKHTVNKVITPDNNPDADAYIFGYRSYGLADVYENKTAGIYLSYKAE